MKEIPINFLAIRFQNWCCVSLSVRYTNNSPTAPKDPHLSRDM